MITCAEVDELLAAFALDALDDDERAEIEAHLATCDRHADLAELQAVALAFPALAPLEEPSADLERRIMASVTATEAAPAPVVDTPAPAATAAPMSIEPHLERQRGRDWRWPAAIAAALAVLFLGAGMLAMILQDGDDATIVYVYRDGDSYFRAERTGAQTVDVTMGGLVQLPATESYQLWALRDGEWHSVGVCNTDDDGWWRGDFDFALGPRDRLVLTIEPATGSPSPTGPVILGRMPEPEEP